MWLDILQFIYSFVKSQTESNKEENERLSQFFEQIHQIIQQVVVSLQSDVYPQGSCAAMSAISNQLIDALKNKVEEQELGKLARMLDEASILEKEFAYRKDPNTINNLLKLSPNKQSFY